MAAKDWSISSTGNIGTTKSKDVWHKTVKDHGLEVKDAGKVIHAMHKGKSVGAWMDGVGGHLDRKHLYPKGFYEETLDEGRAFSVLAQRQGYRTKFKKYREKHKNGIGEEMKQSKYGFALHSVIRGNGKKVWVSVPPNEKRKALLDDKKNKIAEEDTRGVAPSKHHSWSPSYGKWVDARSVSGNSPEQKVKYKAAQAHIEKLAQEIKKKRHVSETVTESATLASFITQLAKHFGGNPDAAVYTHDPALAANKKHHHRTVQIQRQIIDNP